MKKMNITIFSSYIKKNSQSFNRLNKMIYNTTTKNFSNTNNENQNKEKEKSFGFKTVQASLHQGMVNEVFSKVSNKYDLMNDVMSLGIHRLWKTEFVNQIGYIKPNCFYNEKGEKEETPLKIIDVAGGTGDISHRILEKAEEYYKANLNSIFPVQITVVDINADMLSEGKKRAEEMGISTDRLDFRECNAETLYLEDNSVDLYTISFGIRNCTNRDVVLKEANRVLKKGGRFMCLEFSHVVLPVMSDIYGFYSSNIIPKMGELVANDRESYQYLIESIQKFPKQEDFKQEIIDAGFKFANYKNLSVGICAIHSGTKI